MLEPVTAALVAATIDRVFAASVRSDINESADFISSTANAGQDAAALTSTLTTASGFPIRRGRACTPSERGVRRAFHPFSLGSSLSNTLHLKQISSGSNHGEWCSAGVIRLRAPTNPTVFAQRAIPIFSCDLRCTTPIAK
jgi:hypothetical protein